MDDDGTLSARLGAFIEAIPVGDTPTPFASRRRAARGPLVATVAALLGALIGASAVIAGPTLLGVPQGHEGAFNKGQPLYCSGVLQMAPPQAEKYLRDRGYAVQWQVEDRPSGDSKVVAEPPAAGFIQGGYVEGGNVFLVVEVGTAAQPANGDGCGP